MYTPMGTSSIELAEVYGHKNKKQLHVLHVSICAGVFLRAFLLEMHMQKHGYAHPHVQTHV